jgi:hypothetical protein
MVLMKARHRGPSGGGTEHPMMMSAPAHGFCVVCGADRLQPLALLALRGVPHDTPGHDVVFGYRRIDLCGSCGQGQLEVHSHDCWAVYDAEGNYEDWDMFWRYSFAASDLEPLRRALEPCPRLLDPGCACPAHEELREVSLRSPQWLRADTDSTCRRYARVRFVRGAGGAYLEMLSEAATAEPAHGPYR